MTALVLGSTCCGVDYGLRWLGEVLQGWGTGGCDSDCLAVYIYGRDGQPSTYQALECAQYCLGISIGLEVPPALDSMVTVSVSGRGR